MNEATADAEAARRALRALAKETAQSDGLDKADTILASLSAATESLSESLHQIAASHDKQNASKSRRAHTSASPPGADYPMSWELHRAGEILHQVSTLLDHAHSAAVRSNTPRLHGDVLGDHTAPASWTGLGR